MKIKVYYERATDTDNEKFRKEKLGGDYPTKFNPCPLWNTKLVVEIIPFKNIKLAFMKEKLRHNKFMKVSMITNMQDRIIFQHNSFKHWFDCQLAQEHLIKLAEQDKGDK